MLPRTKDREEWDVGNGFLKNCDTRIWFHNHRMGINPSDYLNFHTFEKEERISGWQLKDLIITQEERERQVWGRVSLPEWTLTGLQRVSSSSRRTENPEGLLTADFQKTFFPSLLTLTVPSMRAWGLQLPPRQTQHSPWLSGISSCLTSHHPSPPSKFAFSLPAPRSSLSFPLRLCSHLIYFFHGVCCKPLLLEEK